MKRVILILVPIVLIGGSLVWWNRVDLMLALIKERASIDAAPNREVNWNRGPDVADGAERPPNIVFILADDLGYNDISTFGGGVAGGAVKTPGIDQLAAEGVVFGQSYAGNATCAPSRAMLLTGRYPSHTGFEFTPTPAGMRPAVRMVRDSLDTGLPDPEPPEAAKEFDVPYELQGLPPAEITLAEVLQKQGYYTAHIGKWHLGRSQGSAPNDQGFDDSLLMNSGLYLPEDDPDVVNAKQEFDAIDRFLWAGMNYATSFNDAMGAPFKPGGYLTDYWTDEAIKVIRGNKNRPFFLYLAHWGTHSPLQATREDYEAVGDIQPHRLRVYAAMIRALDRSVGRINAALEEEGMADNTIVVFSSDNGGAGYIGLPEVNAPFRGWKLTYFEGGLRVPLFIKWPERISAGLQVSQPVTHVDVMPTLVAASGAALPKGVAIDGKNLLPLTTAQGRDNWPSRALFWQSGNYRVVRQDDWKLQISDDPHGVRLFNLANDPTEQNDLSGSAPVKVAELKALLEQHRASGRKPLYPSTSELAVAVDKTLAEPFVEGDEYILWPN